MQILTYNWKEGRTFSAETFVKIQIITIGYFEVFIICPAESS